MNTFSPSGRVYVLGAGASVFAGYPLASGLLPFIRELQSFDTITKDIASRVLEKLSQAEFQFKKSVVRDPNKDPNLEEVLTYLELYRSFPGTPFDWNPWDSSDSAAVRRVVTERFLGYQHDLHKTAWGSGPTPGKVSVDPNQFRIVADAWARTVRPGDVILTFNWDLLHEVILWRSGLWSYRDGYGFECDGQGQREESSKVRMLKLHGSLNWVQEDDCDPVTEIANVGDFFAQSRDWEWRDHSNQAQVDSGRKLVLPTYLKDISSNKALLDVWSQAHQAIANAKELFVIGYSLNRVDHPARLLFGIALSENVQLDRVTVVSPDTAEWDSFLGQVRKAMIRIPQKFEQWVCGAKPPTPKGP